MLQVGCLELVKALELVERREFLGCTARAAERTEHALCVVPVDAGGVPAGSEGEGTQRRERVRALRSEQRALAYMRGDAEGEGYLCSRQLRALTRLTDGGRFPMRSDPGTIWALHIPSWQTLRPFFAYETCAHNRARQRAQTQRLVKSRGMATVGLNRARRELERQSLARSRRSAPVGRRPRTPRVYDMAFMWALR